MDRRDPEKFPGFIYYAADMKKGAVRKSIDASTKDGIAWSVMAGFVESYTVPFAKALKAGSMEIGILRSLAPLLSSLGQLRIADWVN